jgi:hypothetical protein
MGIALTVCLVGLAILGVVVSYRLGIAEGYARHQREVRPVLKRAETQLNGIADALDARGKASKN